MLSLVASLLRCRKPFLSLPSYLSHSFALDRRDFLPGFHYSPFRIEDWQTIPPSQASSVPKELL